MQDTLEVFMPGCLKYERSAGRLEGADVRVLCSQSWLVQGGPVLELVSTPLAACD